MYLIFTGSVVVITKAGGVGVSSVHFAFDKRVKFASSSSAKQRKVLEERLHS